MDKKAKKILIKTFWSSTGWRFNCYKITDVIKEGFLTQEDFDYCKEKGVMFDPITITHDECLKRYYNAIAKISKEQVIKAFICSLSTRSLYLRSAVTSYYNSFKVNESWNNTPEDYIYRDEDLNVLNFERVKWGGIRINNILYCMFDLEQFPIDVDFKPTDQDIKLLKDIIKTIETSEAEDGPTQLRERLNKVFPTNKHESGVMVEILCELGIIVPSKSRPIRGRSNDWREVEHWRGEDGYDKNKVEELFGKYIF